EASDSKGFIGVIYADGNNIGQLLEQLKTPSEYFEFANTLYTVTEDAVFESLAENLRTREIESDDTRSPTHTFEILSIGGDDVFLIVPAHVALPIACAIAEKAENKLRDHALFQLLPEEAGGQGYEWKNVQRCRGVSPTNQGKVSFSVGVDL